MKAQQKIERASRANKRLHLIEATITALHIYGPSRTTVDKIVEIAHMSPGIVTFYFDSKAAMLVAALEHLATEYEEKVLRPVSALSADPVAALNALVALYFDPEISSSRKISVWYAFWGEASSRQEYIDICGRKDAASAAAVRDYIAALIELDGRPELDPDAIALGLVGVLEVLWQEMAFLDDADIDRAAMKRRCFAYLSSIFPRHFSPAARLAGEGARSGAAVELPRALLPVAGDPAQSAAAEHHLLFFGQWQYVGHQSALSHAGAFITADIAGERVLVVRDRAKLRGFHNLCRNHPHAVATAARGQFTDQIDCAADGWRYKLDGSLISPVQAVASGDAASMGLARVEIETVAGLIFGRLAGAANSPDKPHSLPAAFGLEDFEGIGEPVGYEIASDWKTMIEQMLEASFIVDEDGAGRQLMPEVTEIDQGAGTIRSRAIVDPAKSLGKSAIWVRYFAFPNLMIELLPRGAAVWSVFPLAPGHCRLSLSFFSPKNAVREDRALVDHSISQVRYRMEVDIAIAESTEIGLHSAFLSAPSWRDANNPVTCFRSWIDRAIGG